MSNIWNNVFGQGSSSSNLPAQQTAQQAGLYNQGLGGLGHTTSLISNFNAYGSLPPGPSPMQVDNDRLREKLGMFRVKDQSNRDCINWWCGQNDIKDYQFETDPYGASWISFIDTDHAMAFKLRFTNVD